MRPFTLLIKPTGPDCNIRCTYCFYACKTALFGTGPHRMSDTVAETMIRDYLSYRFPASSFAWQGGEPCLMGLDFYRRVVEWQKRYGADGQVVTNALQTNGTLLDDDWGRFLAEYKFLVGISLDGPQEIHDHYRRDGAGRGTWQRVMDGIDVCRRHGVEYNILVLLNDHNVEQPDVLWDFFMDQGIRFLQFIQCVELDPQTRRPMPFSITAEQYGRFLCRIFDRWMAQGPRTVSIRIFDSILSQLLGTGPTECTFGTRCNDYIVIEHTGEAFCCDFFVDNPWRLGNILETPMKVLAGSELKRRFARRKRDIPHKCLVCRYLDLCRGGCPKDRLAMPGADSPDAKVESYFCRAYKMLFDHALPTFRALADELRAEQAPAGGRTPWA